MRTIINFRHLEAIRAVMMSGSVTGAGERLHVTQSAISHLLRDAEERLGYSLFERRLGRLTPTRRAELIFEQIERSFSGLEAVSDFCIQLRDTARRQIVIASIPTIAAAVLPRMIHAYQKIGAKDFFQIKAANTEAGITAVRFGTVNLSFGLNLDPIPGVESADICQSNAICFLPPGHALQSKRVITADDVKGLPMITLSRMEGIAQNISASVPDFDQSAHAVVESPSAITVAALVEAGVGYTLLDPITASMFQSSQIVFRRFAEDVSFTHRAYWSKSAGPDVTRDHLIELAQATAKSAIANVLARLKA